MNEVEYEKLVDRLAQKYENAILSVAISAISPDADDYDEATQAAHDAVFDDLLGDPRWEKVEAVDISDLAYDAAQRAWSQRRAWEEGL